MKRIIFLNIFLFLNFGLFAQKNITVSGFVRDSLSREVLIGATVVVQDQNRGVLTDNLGFYSLQLQTPATIRVSYVGYSPQVINLHSDTLLTVYLTSANQLEDVVVVASRPAITNGIRLSSKELLKIPTIGARPDLSHILQVMPGIAAQNEGMAALLVRGGDPGQNLYLFDNVPVIYVNHIGGFMSVFNPDIINNIDVYKGGFPARLGGRLSSVVDIAQREGDMSQLRGSLSIGLTDVAATIEGPTKIKNSSFIITGRKTLIEALQYILSLSADPVNSSYSLFGFHDINGKFTWKPNQRNTLSFNVYHGDDYLGEFPLKQAKDASKQVSDIKNNNIWGNWLASASWRHLLGDKLIGFHSLSYTRYRLKQKFTFTEKLDNQSLRHRDEYLSSVQDVSLRSTLKYSPFNFWNMEFGLQGSLLFYLPFYANLTGVASVPKTFTPTSEDAIFWENRFTFFRNSSITLGVRGVGYFNGDFSDYNLEPRARLSIGVAQGQFINASYMRVKQYSHLIFSNRIDLIRNEVWVPAGDGLPPALSEQFSLGWQGDFAQGTYSSEVALYYKTLSQLAMFREGYNNFDGNVQWVNMLATGGNGKVQGLELMFKKNRGDFTGFVAYTLSHATRQYDEINRGNEFDFEYDRRHDLSISLSYKITPKLDINMLWVYQTGLPYTPALGSVLAFDGDGNLRNSLVYGERNSDHMRDYHRLDLSLNYHKVGRRGRRVEWCLAVYNLYNRQNPYRYYYNTSDTEDFYREGDLKLYQSSFFPIIPTISYKIYFDGQRKNSPNDKQNNGVGQRLKNWFRKK